MNPNHYPSLELCKKLTEAGFPETENFKTNYIGNFEEVNLVCPSVMELLDEMPKDVGDYSLKINFFDENIYYISNGEFTEVLHYTNIKDTLPNALAEMWLWLKENNYLIK